MSQSISINSLMDITCSTILNVPYDVPKLQEPRIFFNGGLHWVANAKGSPHKSVIICFDIEQKIVREVEVPSPGFVHRCAFISLGVLSGQLCMLSMRYNTGKDRDMGNEGLWSKGLLG
ncbi:hypothetical protein FRX31_021787 [Thalictrum thalictroides]|uniref:F-box protein n=1 Tax=Thalictrum thalictroides TaxID=46969 RepID=A0A7J6VUT9_THATH|nr:hypothetical protein FRX31_021787 [Thalictrum thalictroides]